MGSQDDIWGDGSILIIKFIIMQSLKSSACQLGQTVTQILINNTGQKKTYRGVITSTIEEGSRCKFRTTDGRLIMVRDADTWIVEVHEEKVLHRYALDTIPQA